MDFALSGTSTSKIALLVDYENTVPAGGGDLSCLLDQAAESGTVVIRRAYANWARFPSHKPMMRSAGFEMIDVACVNGKNSVDIKLVVDAMEIAFAKPYVDTFIIVSGDSDFIPLVVKLNELNRRAWLCLGQRKPSPALAKFCFRLPSGSAAQPVVTVDKKSASAQRIGPTIPKQQPVPSLASPSKIKLSTDEREKFKRAVQLCASVVVPPLPLNWLFATLQILEPKFDPKSCAGSPKRHRVRLAEHLQQLGLLKVALDVQAGQHLFSPTEPGDTLSSSQTVAAPWAEAVAGLQQKIFRNPRCPFKLQAEFAQPIVQTKAARDEGAAPPLVASGATLPTSQGGQLRLFADYE